MSRRPYAVFYFDDCDASVRLAIVSAPSAEDAAREYADGEDEALGARGYGAAELRAIADALEEDACLELPPDDTPLALGD